MPPCRLRAVSCVWCSSEQVIVRLSLPAHQVTSCRLRSGCSQAATAGTLQASMRSRCSRPAGAQAARQQPSSTACSDHWGGGISASSQQPQRVHMLTVPPQPEGQRAHSAAARAAPAVQSYLAIQLRNVHTVVPLAARQRSPVPGERRGEGEEGRTAADQWMAAGTAAAPAALSGGARVSPVAQRV